MSYSNSAAPPQREQIANTAGLLSVYDGRCCIGFLARRGRKGVEGYGTSNNSIGIFETEELAAAAVWRHAHGQVLASAEAAICNGSQDGKVHEPVPIEMVRHERAAGDLPPGSVEHSRETR
jgi:hypothetical protein